MLAGTGCSERRRFGWCIGAGKNFLFCILVAQEQMQPHGDGASDVGPVGPRGRVRLAWRRVTAADHFKLYEQQEVILGHWQLHLRPAGRLLSGYIEALSSVAAMFKALVPTNQKTIHGRWMGA